MAIPEMTRVSQFIKEIMYPLSDWDEALDPLMERIGDARFVLLGEASHGTSEDYRWRTRVTRRLILEKGVNFIGVEGDFAAELVGFKGKVPLIARGRLAWLATRHKRGIPE